MKAASLSRSLCGSGLLLLASVAQSHGSLAALWQFDSNTGATQADSSANGNTASVVNGTAWTVDGTRGSGVMDFDGSNDYLEAADSGSLSITSNLTIALWVNVTSAGGFGQWRGLVTKDTSGTGTAAPYQFWFNQANLFPNYVAGNGTTQDVAGSTVVVPTTGVWEHWAVTLSGSTVTMFRDGIPISMTDTSVSGTTYADGGGTLRIGDREGAQDMSFFGRMDDVAIFDEALSQAQINEIMGGDFSAFGVSVPEPSRALFLLGGMLFAGLRRRR